MVNGGDISNQLISAGKCSLCLSRCDQSVTTVGVCWWNCLGASMFVNVRRCSSCSYGKDLKSFAHIPRCPDAAWIDDRNVSAKKFMGQKTMLPVNLPSLAMCVALALSETWTSIPHSTRAMPNRYFLIIYAFRAVFQGRLKVSARFF